MALISREKANTRVVSEETRAAIGANRKYIDFKYSVTGKGADAEKGTEEVRNERFILSQAKIKELELEKYGLRQYAEDGADESGVVNEEAKAVYLAVCDDAYAAIMKQSKKGKKGRVFSSTVLRDDLVATGLLPETVEKGSSVKFDLVETDSSVLGDEVAEKGIVKVLKVVLSADQSADADDEAGEVKEEVSTKKSKKAVAEPVAETVEAEFE